MFQGGGVYAADVFVKADQLGGYVFTNTSKLVVNGRELKRKSFGGTGDTNVMAGTYYFDGLGSVPENYGYTEGVWRYVWKRLVVSVQGRHLSEKRMGISSRLWRH